LQITHQNETIVPTYCVDVHHTAMGIVRNNFVLFLRQLFSS